MRVTIDETRCNGNASCVLRAPDVFELTDDGAAARVLIEDVEGAQADLVRELVTECPTQAILASDK